MSWTRDLTAGVAAYLAGQVAGGVWQPSGAYPGSAGTPFFVSAVPDRPDRLVTVTHYPVEGGGWTSDVVAGIQLRYRSAGADPRPTDDLGDELREAFDGLEHVVFGGVRVSLVTWQSGASLGQDSARRWESTDSYHLYTARRRRNTSD